MTNSKILVLLDADVVIHLYKADRISILQQIYPERLVILDIVLNELRNNRTICKYIDNFFLFAGIKEIRFPTTSHPEIFNEFINLKSKIDGQGERACLIYCKHFKHIIASSNTSDIKDFCFNNGIAYLTTLDIFAIAIKRGIMTSREVNESIKKIIRLSSYLCCTNIKDHLINHFDTTKYAY